MPFILLNIQRCARYCESSAYFVF